MPKCNGGELFEFLANETEASNLSWGVRFSSRAGDPTTPRRYLSN